ncbi:winged helix-turn-helix domain-containing protein [Aeromicrobium fastidiosum]|uniref:Helix-turn-helix domain-containing protein n=1 Tax=Aeromicrobium fastidiosum TaxID=52699 RepID=A0A641AJN2_9ACTN|nr:winged helix-turn-helix domain-containing protein [Aeromicrobium fastidiosum]KAA1373763.1 helix-turn-helix domain-containing protein [Aeromicrobium fastidiosum]MBP2391334.1 DNA-binding transcriptional ArsR family regulator [Aeromicrobium fastidiosum]
MPFTSKVVDDLETLKAVSHPLRLELLGRLRTAGPATASQLGRALGQSSGSTSYHLRQLERFGFVADDEEQPSARERRWRALHDATSFPSSLSDLDGGREYVDAVRRRQERYLREGLEAWTEPRPGIGMSDYGLRLDPADLQALQDELHAVVTRYTGRAGTEDVVLHVLTLPRPTAP